MVWVRSYEVRPEHVFEVQQENVPRFFNDMDVQYCHFEEVKNDVEALDYYDAVQNILMAIGLFVLKLPDCSFSFTLIVVRAHQ